MATTKSKTKKLKRQNEKLAKRLRELRLRYKEFRKAVQTAGIFYRLRKSLFDSYTGSDKAETDEELKSADDKASPCCNLPSGCSKTSSTNKAYRDATLSDLH
jgi:hypothetical protein